MMSISERNFRNEVVIGTEKTKERGETERESLTPGKEMLEKSLTTVLQWLSVSQPMN